MNIYSLIILLMINNIKLVLSRMNRIRQAKISDLPSIHNLIRHSYMAMLEHTGEEMRERWEKGAEESIVSDLSEDKFESIYTSKFGNNFWVSIDNDNTVTGCVAIKRTTQDEAELIRMAVDPTIRSKGIGGSLIENLLSYAKEHGVLRLSLVTANPLAAKFYSKNRFATYHSFKYPYTEGKFLTVFRMVYYLGEKIIRNVVIFGGTHGNERIGVELIKSWEEKPDVLKRSTLNVKCVIGNVDATACNRRYVDVDLNRQFLSSDLCKESTTITDKSEVKRAKELNSLYGPKGSIEMNCGSDFIIDLHSSNSAVGLVCMISGENDTIALRIAAKLQKKFPSMKITCSTGAKDTSWSADSVSENGLSLEVGPLAHGTVQYDLLDKTRKMVYQIINDLEERNLELIAQGNISNSFGRDIVWVDPNSNEKSTISPTDNFESIEIYLPVQRITYPIDDLKYTIHPQLQGKDWEPLKLKDVVLISIDGEKEVILRDLMTIKDAKEDDSYYPLFINEAAYLESNVAFAVYTKKDKIIS